MTMGQKKTFEQRHRERKRRLEIMLAMEALSRFVKDAGRSSILEFGSGRGYQLPYLEKLGDVVGSDLDKSAALTESRAAKFVICDIAKAPFTSGSFDIIFSNHVLEHIRDIKTAFSELKRVGKVDAVYAFTVPTSTWLLLSVPAQCYNGIRRLLAGGKTGAGKEKRSGRRSFFPKGHGWQEDFFACFGMLKPRAWLDLFRDNGFDVLKVSPLLLYAPSEFPIVPTTRFPAKRGICSSMIYIMKKSL